MTMTFENNWTHLAIRHAYQAAGLSWDKETFPLSENFVKWAGTKWMWIKRKLETDPRLFITYEPFSQGDYINHALRTLYRQGKEGTCDTKWIVKDKTITPIAITPYKFNTGQVTENPYLTEAFPISDELDMSMNADWKKLIKSIDRKLNEWNPRVKSVEELMEATEDEHGNPVDDGYNITPEIIGELDNPQLKGIDEYGDAVYTDFDTDGVFQPMGNPHNSSDTRDDVDLTDHTNYKAQDWQSLDLIDDHNVDIHYREECVTETPTFTKDGSIEWTTENHSDIETPVAAADDMDWVEDARNFLTRGRLIQDITDEDEIIKILSAYPVSSQFMEYIENQEISWEIANERLQQLTGLRETATNDLKLFGAEVPPVEESPTDYDEVNLPPKSSYIPDIPFA